MAGGADAGGATLYVNGVIHTMAEAGAPADAIAVRGGRILSVGDARDVRGAAGAGAIEVDLGGRAVAPGFIDAHHHFFAAIADEAAIECGPEAARSIDEILRRFARAAREQPEAQWIVGTGFDELAIAEGRHPTRRELDEACGGRAALLCHYSGHEGVASSRAMELGRLDEDAPDPPGGMIERGRRGGATGRILETAYSRVYCLAQQSLIDGDLPGLFARLRRYEAEMFGVGVTRVCDPAVSPNHEQIYRKAAQQGHLRMPVVMLASSADGHLCPPWDRVDGPRVEDWPEPLSRGHLKLFFDGATLAALRMTLGQLANSVGQLLAHAARTRSLGILRSGRAMSLSIGRDLMVRTGLRLYTRDEGRRIVEAAGERGWPIAIHALGNDAVDQAIDALSSQRDRYPDRPPPRIEHASVINREAARRAADAGIAIVSQPAFLLLPAFESMPSSPGLRVLAHRTQLSAGVRVAGGSDAPVANANPLDAMRAAVSRTTASGTLVQPEEAVSPGEVLAMYTREAAYVTGCLDVTGTLEPGKRADMVVLSADPCSASPGQLASLRVEQTILGGETVFQL